MLRHLEGDAGDAFDLPCFVDLRVDGALAAAGQVLDAARLAKVDAAGELAQDHDVEPGHQFMLERRGLRQRLEAERRAQVGEQIHVLAQAQKSALGLHLEGQVVPFGAADGAEQHRVGRHRLLHGLVGDRRALLVDGDAADEALVDVELDRAAAIEPVDDPAHLVHHLRPDTVARQDQQALVRTHGFPFLIPNMPGPYFGQSSPIGARQARHARRGGDIMDIDRQANREGGNRQ